MLKYIKSPMNYLGNKSRLLTQILPLLPQDINNFYDVFCGGLDVSLNVKANNIYANDKHEDLIWLYNEIIKHGSNKLGDELYELDKKYFPMNNFGGKSINTYHRTGDKETWNRLMNEKREAYYKMRDNFNNGNCDFKILISLMLNSIGIIEFRVVNRYITFACGNARINKKIQMNLNKFQENIQHINLSNNDFRYIKNIEFKENDFVYLDPPYLGTSQYKTKWTNDDEKDLYELVDYLHSKNVKFALSNFADGVNHTNEYLAKWCSKYNIRNLKDKHERLNGISNLNLRQEILITNY